MSLKKFIFAMFVSMAAFGTQATAQVFDNGVIFDWTQYSTNTSYRAQGHQVGSGYNQATYDMTYVLNGRREGAQLTVQWVQNGIVSFTFYNRRNGASCPGTARWQGNVYYGSMSCRSGEHPVSIYL